MTFYRKTGQQFRIFQISLAVLFDDSIVLPHQNSVKVQNAIGHRGERIVEVANFYLLQASFQIACDHQIVGIGVPCEGIVGT